MERNGFIRFIKPLIWKTQYQRNNKSNGQKNLRCFPGHCETGHQSSFCGTSICIEFVFQSKFKYSQLCALAMFCTSESDGEYTAGKVLSLYDISENHLRDDANPLRKLIEGIPIGSGGAKYIDYPTNSKAVGFEFNGELKGWHYGYTSSRKTKNQMHSFKVFVLELQNAEIGTYKIVATKTSPPWKLYCRRRSRRTDFTESNARFRLLETLISQHGRRNENGDAINTHCLYPNVKVKSEVKKCLKPSSSSAQVKRKRDSNKPKHAYHACGSRSFICSLIHLLSLFDFQIENLIPCNDHYITLKSSISWKLLCERLTSVADNIYNSQNVQECEICSSDGVRDKSVQRFAIFLLKFEKFRSDICSMAKVCKINGGSKFADLKIKLSALFNGYLATFSKNSLDGGNELFPTNEDLNNSAFQCLSNFNIP